MHQASQEKLQSVNDNIFHGKPQAQIGLANDLPQYMYSFQGPVAQQMSPYQGYAFSGMQFSSPYYLGNLQNMQWPPCTEESNHGISKNENHHRRSNKPPHMKERYSNGKANKSKQTTLGLQDGYSDQISSGSGSESIDELDRDMSSDRETLETRVTEKQRPKNKSSRTVVIRNINYISSKGKDGGSHGSSDESLVKDDFLDGDFLKDKVKNVVDSIQKHRKSSRHRNKERCHVMDSSKADHGENSSEAKACDVEKSDESWKAFQNILMKEEEFDYNKMEHRGRGIADDNSQQSVEVGNEYFIIKDPELTEQSVHSRPLDVEIDTGTKHHPVATDSIIITERDANIADGRQMENFECDENYCRSLQRTQGVNEDVLYMQSTKPQGNVQHTSSKYMNEPFVLRNQRGEDWFVVSQSDRLAEAQLSAGHTLYEDDQAQAIHDDHKNSMETNEKKPLIDDSFMVPARSIINEQHISQWETDVSIISGITLVDATCHADNMDHSKEKVRILHDCEPDDLQMVLERNPGIENVHWIPEIDYTVESTYAKVDEQNSGAERNSCTDDIVPPNCKEGKNNGDIEKKSVVKNGGIEKKLLDKGSKTKVVRGSLGNGESNVLSSNRRPPTISKAAPQKSKIEKVLNAALHFFHIFAVSY